MFDVVSIAYWFLSLSSRVSGRVLLLLINLHIVLVFFRLLLIVVDLLEALRGSVFLCTLLGHLGLGQL